MKKEIIIGKVTISCDLKRILNNVRNWEYDEDSYDGIGEIDVCTDFSVSKQEWEREKDIFIKMIEELDNNETKLQSFMNMVSTNKNGSLSKNRRNAILNFKPVRDYNNSYGSHSYYVDALMVQRVSEFEGKLVLSSYKEQSSF